MPALVTPFDRNGNVSEGALRELAAYHLTKKSAGFYLCGTTGQGLWMSTAERKRILEVVLDAVRDAVPVIAHVGCVAPAEAAELAVHAAKVGASGISSIIPPTYATLESIVAYFDMLSKHAPETPLLPYFMGTPLPPMQIMEGLSKTVTLAGTKYTGPNMYEMRKIIEIGSEPWSVFSGMDEQCVFGAMCGADGAIGSSINVMPGIYKEIRRLVAEDRQGEAYALQERANGIITVLISYGYPGALKAAHGILGFDCGDPRLPEMPFDSSKTDNLKADLNAAGFEEISSM